MVSIERVPSKGQTGSSEVVALIITSGCGHTVGAGPVEGVGSGSGATNPSSAIMPLPWQQAGVHSHAAVVPLDSGHVPWKHLNPARRLQGPRGALGPKLQDSWRTGEGFPSLFSEVTSTENSRVRTGSEPVQNRFNTTLITK